MLHVIARVDGDQSREREWRQERKEKVIMRREVAPRVSGSVGTILVH